MRRKGLLFVRAGRGSRFGARPGHPSGTVSQMTSLSLESFESDEVVVIGSVLLGTDELVGLLNPDKLVPIILCLVWVTSQCSFTIGGLYLGSRSRTGHAEGAIRIRWQLCGHVQFVRRAAFLRARALSIGMRPRVRWRVAVVMARDVCLSQPLHRCMLLDGGIG